jgi:SNF2 family DNA or RNA helicase
MTLKTELMPHQRAAVDKLSGLKVAGLFMEMGTGKSRTVMELVARKQAAGKISKVIWMAPVSLKETVRQEILKHSEGEQIQVFNGRTREDNMPSAFWNVVGIESMSGSERVLYAVDALVDANTCVIVDESTYIKGHHASRTNWITKIGARAKYRYILTGTPLSQGVVDLYSQMRFLSPQILGFPSFYSFERRHLEYSEKYPGLIRRTLHTEEIAAKIAPYVYQVKKDECLDLPNKLYTTRYCCMTDEQRDMYEQVKCEFAEQMLSDDDWASQLAIFRLFSALQQVACGFRHIKDKATKQDFVIELKNDRLDTLQAALNQIPPGEKVIIWAKYRHDVEAICKLLGDAAVSFYGDLSEAQRNANVGFFRREAQYFVATQDCGGHGLTLNEASYVIFYNNQFKYSSRMQAEDRNHRIGQSRKVTYTDILCSNSIDDRIAKAQDCKANVAQDFRDKIQRLRGDKNAMRELINSL